MPRPQLKQPAGWKRLSQAILALNPAAVFAPLRHQP